MNSSHYKQIIALYNDFKYDQQTSSSGKSELTEDITDQFNPEEYADGNTKFHDLDTFSKFSNKENIIITSWYVKELPQKLRLIFIDFIAHLIKDNYPVYVSQEHGLEKIKTVFAIEKELYQLKPVNRRNAELLAEPLGLKKKSLRMINTPLLQAILKEAILFNKTKHTDLDLYILSFPFIPPYYSKEKIKLISSCIDPEEQFSVLLSNTETHCKNEPRIGTLCIAPHFMSGVVTLTEDDIKEIVQCYPNVNTLAISTVSMDIAGLLSHYPNLSSLSIRNCTQTPKSDAALTAQLSTLHQLTELNIETSVRAPFINTLLFHNANLRRFSLSRTNASFNPDFFSNLPANHFQKLNFLNLDVSGLPEDSWKRIFDAVPKLKIGIFEFMILKGNAFPSSIKPECLELAFTNARLEDSFQFLSLFEIFPNLSRLKLNELSPGLYKHCSPLDKVMSNTCEAHNTHQCKKLKQIKTLHFHYSLPCMNMVLLRDFLSLFENLHELSLRALDFGSSAILHRKNFNSALPVRFPNLEVLETNILEMLNWMTASTSTLRKLDIIFDTLYFSTKLGNLITLLNNNPHLETLSISNLLSLRNSIHDFNLTPECLKKLYYLDVSSDLYRTYNSHDLKDPLAKEVGAKLFNAAQNVMIANTNDLTFSEENIFSTFNCLTTIESWIFFKGLQKIASRAPNLHAIKLSADYYEENFFQINLNIPLPQVKSLSIEFDDPKPSARILFTLFPNLVDLSVKSRNFYRSNKLNMFFDASLPATLKKIKYDSFAMTFHDIKSMLTPNLIFFSMDLSLRNRSGFALTDAEIEQLEKEYPYIHFSLKKNTTIQINKLREPLTYHLNDNDSEESDEESEKQENANNIYLKPPQLSTLHAKKRFFSRGSMVESSLREEYVILKQYCPDKKDDPWQIYQPKESELEDCSFDLLTELNSNAIIRPHCFFGVEQYNGIEPNVWHMLPAPSTHSIHDQLLTFWSNSTLSLTIKRHKTLGLFYFRFEGSQKLSIQAGYHLFSPPTPPPSQSPIMPIIKQLISSIRFDNDSLTLQKNSPAYQMLLEFGYATLIQSLREFFTFPNSNQAIPQQINFRTHADQFNFLIQYRPGLIKCIDRATVHAATSESFNIQTLLNLNELHAFSVHLTPDRKFVPINLGGQPAEAIHVNDFALENLEKHFQQKQKIKLPTSISPNNRFQTWKQEKQSIQTMDALFDSVFSNGFKQELVIVKTESCVESIHDALCKRDDFSSVFFSPDLDSLSLVSKKFIDGIPENTDSPLALFLKKPSQKPLFWFINWSHPKQEHAGYQSIFSSQRKLKNVPIPDHVHVIVLMDEDTQQVIGNRFQKTMQVVIEALFVPELEPVSFETHPIQEGDVVVYTEKEWQRILLGYFEIKAGKLVLVTGKLFHSNGSFTLHNPPVENKEFRYFMREYKRNGWFWFKGMYVHTGIPNITYSALKLETAVFDQPSYSFPIHLILNQNTFADFFEKDIVTQNGIQKADGLLKQCMYSTTHLTMTHTLSTGQLFKLVNEIKTHHIYPIFETTPNVDSPAVLSTKQVDMLASIDSNRIAVIATNDVDYALDEIQKRFNDTAEEIPISPKDGFYSQFLQLKKNETGDFISVKTELNQLIRSGKPILFFGDFSENFSKKSETLFSKKPYVVINNEWIEVPGHVFFITQNPGVFSEVNCMQMNYDVNSDLNKLPVPLQNELNSVYEKLGITPAHGHFRHCPFNHPDLIQPFCLELIERLYLSKGIYLPSQHFIPPTTPDVVFNMLKRAPFLSLISETGQGKSYFFDHPLAAVRTVYHEEKSMEQVLSDPLGCLIIDEINTENDDRWVFSNCARGQRLIWKNGNKNHLTQQTFMFAGNSNQYGDNRKEPDLLRRFPFYMQFVSDPISVILKPLLRSFEHSEYLIKLIEWYYDAAKKQNIPISIRNAENICMVTFALRKILGARFSDEALMLYAILFELNTLLLDQNATKALRTHLKKSESHWLTFGSELKQALKTIIQDKMQTSDHVWISRDEKIALTLMILLLVREERKQLTFGQHQGISSLLLEGTSEQGIDELVPVLFDIFHLKPAWISLTEPLEALKQIQNHFHEANEIYIPEYNTGHDEKPFNCYWSGVDHFKKSPGKNGFFSIATQEPISSADADALSKAQVNRSATIRLKDYTERDLLIKLTKTYHLEPFEAKNLLQEFAQAKNYAKENSFFEKAPSVKHLFDEAEKIRAAKQSSHAGGGKRTYPF